MKCPIKDVVTENRGTVTRLRLSGPLELKDRVLEWVYGLGGTVMEDGPNPNLNMVPPPKPPQFLILAEIRLFDVTVPCDASEEDE